MLIPLPAPVPSRTMVPLSAHSMVPCALGSLSLARWYAVTLRYLWLPWLLTAALATPPGSRRPHVIAPLPTVLPSGLQDSSSQALFDSLLASQLTGAGFIVLPPAATDSVWRETVRAAGGYFDPHSGFVVPEKLWAAPTATLERLQGTVAVDALLFPEIKVVTVHYYKSWAVWDPTSERVLLDSGSGDVPALTLQVVVTEADGGNPGTVAAEEFRFL